MDRADDIEAIRQVLGQCATQTLVKQAAAMRAEHTTFWSKHNGTVGDVGDVCDVCGLLSEWRELCTLDDSCATDAAEDAAATDAAAEDSTSDAFARVVSSRDDDILARADPKWREVAHDLAAKRAREASAAESRHYPDGRTAHRRCPTISWAEFCAL